MPREPADWTAGDTASAMAADGVTEALTAAPTDAAPLDDPRLVSANVGSGAATVAGDASIPEARHCRVAFTSLAIELSGGPFEYLATRFSLREGTTSHDEASSSAATAGAGAFSLCVSRRSDCWVSVSTCEPADGLARSRSAETCGDKTACSASSYTPLASRSDPMAAAIGGPRSTRTSSRELRFEALLWSEPVSEETSALPVASTS